MWVFTQHGFASIVQHRDHADRYLVRARVRNDLEALLERAGLQAPIDDYSGTDYPFRVEITEAELGRLFGALQESIDYPNFKGRVAQGQGYKRADLYHEIWALLGGGLGWARREPFHDQRALFP